MAINQWSTNNIIYIIVSIIIITGLVVAAHFWLKGISSYTSKSESVMEKESLYCTSSDFTNDGFFNSTYDAIDASQTIKIAFSNSRINGITYNYEGTYKSTGRAESAQSFLHSDYNIYMGNHGLSQEYLSPTFTTIDNITRVNLYTDVNMINSKTAIFFFLNDDDYKNISNYSIDEIENIYKNKGFSCDYQE